jgi:hypothetical protein
VTLGCRCRAVKIVRISPIGAPASELGFLFVTALQMSQLGHLRLGRVSSKSGNVRYVAKSRSKLRAFSERHSHCGLMAPSEI